MTMILTSVTMVGWADVQDSDWGDFRRRLAVDISSLYNHLYAVDELCISLILHSLIIAIKCFPHQFKQDNGHSLYSVYVSLQWPAG